MPLFGTGVGDEIVVEVEEVMVVECDEEIAVADVVVDDVVREVVVLLVVVLAVVVDIAAIVELDGLNVLALLDEANAALELRELVRLERPDTLDDEIELETVAAEPDINEAAGSEVIPVTLVDIFEVPEPVPALGAITLPEIIATTVLAELSRLVLLSELEEDGTEMNGDMRMAAM